MHKSGLNPVTYFFNFARIFVTCSRTNWLHWPAPLCNVYFTGRCILSRRFHSSSVSLEVICAGTLKGGSGGRRAGCGDCQCAVKILQSPEWLLALKAEEDLLPWPRALRRHTQRLQSALRPFHPLYLRLYPFLPAREMFGSWVALNIGSFCVNTKYACVQSRKIDVMNKRNQLFFLFQLEKMLLFPFSLAWISKVKGNACYLQIFYYRRAVFPSCYARLND